MVQTVGLFSVRSMRFAAALLFVLTELTFLTVFVQPAAAMGDVFRSTTYEFQAGEFTGLTYTLTLNNDLEPHYFTMISGPSISTTTRSPDEDHVRVTGDAHSNFATSTSANELQLTRGNAAFSWIGAVTVVECLLACGTLGFELTEVLETSLTAGVVGAVDVDTDTLSTDHTANTVPFGARFGGGLSTAASATTGYAVTSTMKIEKTGTNQVSFERFGSEGEIPAAATVTTYVTEWGSDWNVQDVNVTGTSTGPGLDAASEYDTTAIASVVRDNSWVWGGGYTRNDGLGVSGYGQAITLGDGVVQATNETSVAVGGESGLIAPGRDFQVYVLEHVDLQVDYRFRPQGDVGAASGFQELDIAVDAPIKSESYDNASTAIQYTEGHRVPLFYNTSSGTGEAYSRTGAWGLRHDGSTNLNYWRAYSGQAVTGWVQSVDFGDFRFSNVDTRQEGFRWRDDTTDVNVAGGWLAAEDTAIAAQQKNTDVRLRIKSANFGTTAEDSGRTYELQFAPKQGLPGCEAASPWVGASDSATDAFELYDTVHITPDGEVTTTSLLSSGGLTYVNGEGRESADTTNIIGPMAANAYTEIEYALRPTDDAVTGETYCFRLFDASINNTLDEYTVYPELEIATTDIVSNGLGEAGTFTSAVDGGWTTVNFIGSYTAPVVVGTTNTHNGQNALVFESRNVTATSAEMRVCESEGSTTNGCDTHVSETVGYMVVDATVAAGVEGIEAGTFSVSGTADTTNVTTTYTESFTSVPRVFANVNTVTSTEFPIEVVIRNTSAGNFNAGICDHLQGSADTCDAAHGIETVGWVAIEPGNEPFQEQHDQGVVNISNSVWTTVTFAPAFVAPPVVIVASQTDAGGQDVEIDEARSVTATGAEIRYCEIDASDACDTHAGDNVAWFAIEPGEFLQTVQLDQDGFRFYDNTDSVTPVTPLDTENAVIAGVDNGDVLRIRVAVQGGEHDIAPQDTTLQFGQGADCSAVGVWNDVGSLGSAAVWRGYDNTTPTDGVTLASSVLDGGLNTVQTYEESNNSVVMPNPIAAGERGEWDWVIENNGAANFTSYCFRMTLADGTPINYTRYPQVTTSTGVSNQAPNDPANLDQRRTSTAVIAVGEVINESTVVFAADVDDADTNDLLELCVEVDPVGTAFSGTEDSCGAAVVYAGTALEAELSIGSFVDGLEYHWQARVRDAAGLYSAWVSFGGNAETAADFSLDLADPTGTVFDGTTTGVDIDYNDGSLNILSANWNISDAGSGITLFEYSVGTSPDGTDIVGWTAHGTSTSVTVTGMTLQTSQVYFVNVRATDDAGNEYVASSDGQRVAPTLSFSTTPGSVEFGDLNIGNSYSATRTTTLTTSTNAYNGYVVRAFATGELTSQYADTVGFFDGGTYASPDGWNPGDYGYGYTSNDTTIQGVNKFSPVTCSGGGVPPCYAPFSTAAPGDIVADHTDTVVGTPITDENFIITHSVAVPATQPFGTYTSEVVYVINAVY